MKSFADAYRTLNPQQKKAVDTIEGPVMVIAGPGTGKTQILTLRIANILLKTQANPENILALTFTENAAAEMKDRLSLLIGPDAYRIQINTFHGFCNELIQKHFDVFHHLSSYLPVSELEEIQMIQDIIEAESFVYLRPSGDPSHFFHPIRKAVGSLKKEGVSPSEFSIGIKKWQEDFEKRDDLINMKGKYKGKMKGFALDEIKRIEKSKELARLYEIYQKRMTEEKYYDFNDMIIEVIKALKDNEEFLAQVRETYQYILIDEHQDTNNAQNTIIEYLCSLDDFPNLFVVGDEKQSIFRFQGASLENFLYFQKTFPRASLIYLQDNYRSTQRILTTSGAFIQHNTASISSSTVLSAHAKHSDREIEMNEYASPPEEWAEIMEKIRLLKESGIPYDEIAILVRKNEDILCLSSLCDKYEIPTYLSTEESIFSDFYIQKIIRLLRAIHTVGNDVDFVHVLLMNIFDCNPLEVYISIDGARKMHSTVWEYLSLEEAPKALSRVQKKLLQWKLQSENEPLDSFFISLLHDSGLMGKILQAPQALSLLGKISVLYEDIKKLQRKNHSLFLSDYLTYLQLLEEHVIAPSSLVLQQRQGRVFVSTIHKAKGLEFTAVFIPQMNDGNWGGQRGHQSLLSIPWAYLSRTAMKKESDSERIEEERRLFYVALTRAKKNLYLSRSMTNEEGKPLPGSRFLLEMPAEQIKNIINNELPNATKERLVATLSDDKSNQKSFDRKEMQEYFSYVFTHSGISVSALNNFVSCPWKYVFRNLIHLPDVRGYHLLLGTAVHETIRGYISSIKNKKKMGSEELLEQYNSIVDAFSASEKDIRLIKEKGSHIIPAFYEKQMKEWSDKRDSEVIIPNLPLGTGIFINGKIDMIEYQKNNNVIVYDFKTGKVKSRNEILGLTKKEDKAYYRQLVFYQLLLSLFKKGLYKMTEGVIEFVESAETGDVRRESFVISSDEVSALKIEIRQMKESILNLSFWDTRCDDETCEYCKLREHFYRPLR